MGKKAELENGIQDLLSGVIGIDREKEITRIDINKIIPNRSQPRVRFESVEMEKMIESIRENGILQPIIVRPVQKGYEIVAGERRWRGARELGLKEIPVVVKELTDEKAMEIALVENLQRADLNPMEKAVAYDNLIKKHKLTQEEVAKRLSVDRSSVANIIRLLELPEEVQDNVSRGTISMGHARALLGTKDKEARKEVCGKIIREGLSVRQTETIVSELKNDKRPVRKANNFVKKSSIILDLEDRLRKSLKTKVSLREKHGRGKLTVEFHNNKQLEQILTKLGVSFAK
ncbi:MAG: ParB/RepB/Spo0J family partition protein [Candidatus Anammoxibacter sp.]